MVCFARDFEYLLEEAAKRQQGAGAPATKTFGPLAQVPAAPVAAANAGTQPQGNVVRTAPADYPRTLI